MSGFAFSYFFLKRNDEKINQNDLRELRNDIATSTSHNFEVLGNLLKTQLELVQNQVHELTKMNDAKHESLRQSVSEHLIKMYEESSKKLELIRSTVEEKLHSTLEKRLGESFKIVSDRLEQVHKGLGEMQNLATGVGDLKKVLTNVKNRGIWGEVQLANIIEQMLTPAQYETNTQVNPKSNERVEFAIKIPNKESGPEFIYLPIDSKFPIEPFYSLINAQEKCDVPAIEEAAKLLETTIKQQAKLISTKYICPPHTTDFAIMFLPIEALYAEVLRRPGLIETLQRDYRIVITCPTTLSAIINSLQMGFRTLAIEKRSSEVWQTLAVVKTEFVKFADILAKTKLKLDQASVEIGNAESKSRTIQKKLQRIESNLPNEENSLLQHAANED